MKKDYETLKSANNTDFSNLRTVMQSNGESIASKIESTMIEEESRQKSTNSAL